MKLSVALFCLSVGVLTPSLFAQPSYIYDQQSSDESRIREGGTTSAYWPLGQSFVPRLDAVGFVRILLTTGGGSGGDIPVVSVRLWSGSLGGDLLATSSPLVVAGAFSRSVDFLFNGTVPVTPGQTYYFEPVALAGGFAINMTQEYGYPDGNAFVLGQARPAHDLWFREGIITPEPAAGALLSLGVAAIFIARAGGDSGWHRPGHKTMKSQTKS